MEANQMVPFEQTPVRSTIVKVAIIDGEAIENLLSPDDVMRILNIEESLFRKIVFRGELKKTKIGKLNRFKPSEVRAYIERQTIEF